MDINKGHEMRQALQLFFTYSLHQPEGLMSPATNLHEDGA